MSLRKNDGWADPLEDQGPDDPYSAERTRLRNAWMGIEERGVELAIEIERDLPDLTRHDLHHFEALRRLAAQIAGPEIELTPAEAYVLRAAIVLHDLGLAVAAYPGGPESLQQGPAWEDAVALAVRNQYGRSPSAEEIANPEPAVGDAATEALLLEQHAARAEELASISWPTADGNGSLFLIEDPDIRKAYARLIGQIAQSHWWPVSRLWDEFEKPLPPPAWLPAEWIVDPLKIACMLRTADAAHLDSSRAPSLSYAVRRPRGRSDDHWRFQNKLHQPRVHNGRLEFASGTPFSRSEVSAWWLCHKLLRVAHDELQAVDNLLADHDRQRLLVRGIAGVDSPERLATFINTHGWLPMDAKVMVTDPPKVVGLLGGQQLYGRDRLVGLRELLQNAMDGIRARRVLENRSADWGVILVRLASDGTNHWLEVEDIGVGMSPHVMTTALLDYGSSFWTTRDVTRELPGLLSRGFKPAGRFGIGFYAAFMLGSSVTVTSRRADQRPDETYVLDFAGGVEDRAILSLAEPEEQRREPGTVARVLLAGEPNRESGLPYASTTTQAPSLQRLCAYIAPTSDVTIEVDEYGRRSVAVRANDWRHLDDRSLVERYSEPRWELRSQAQLDEDALHLTPIEEADGEIVGRCSMGTALYDTDAGVVVVDGLRSIGTKQIAGVLLGRAETAARDVATPLVSPDALRRWATGQARHISKRKLDGRRQRAAAWGIHHCGGDTLDLPICMSADGPLSFDAFVQWAGKRDEVLAVGELILYQDLPHGVQLKLAPDTIACPINIQNLFLQGREFSHWPIAQDPTQEERNAAHPIYSALLEAWGADTFSRTSGKRTLKPRVASLVDGLPVRTIHYQLYLKRYVDLDGSAAQDRPDTRLN